jgi:hypothetical protein
MGKKQAFRNQCSEYILTSRKNRKDLDLFITNKSREIYDILKRNLKKHSCIKFILYAHCTLWKLTEQKKVLIQPFFPSEVKFLVGPYQVKGKVRTAFQEILAIFDNFVEKSSGWVLQTVENIQVNVAKYIPCRGGCGSVTLPKVILNKKACLSIKCFDDKCFLYAILASLFPVKHNRKNDPNCYKHLTCKLNTSSLSYPVSVLQINSFEVANNISVNVFGYNHSRVIPLYVSSVRGAYHHVNLLLFGKHYYLVTRLSALLAKQYSSYHKVLHYCNYCLCFFKSKQRLEVHTQYCSSNSQMFEMPPDRTFLKFKNIAKQVPSPFVIYCDFETCQGKKTRGQSKCLSKKEHQAIAFGAMRVSQDERYNGKLVTYIGDDCIDKFFRYLEKQWKIIEHILYKKKVPMNYNRAAKQAFEKATCCYLCGKKLKYYQKVRDHCHLDGSFRGAACLTCNLIHASITNVKVPCVIHNGSNFDFNLLVQHLHKVKNRKISILAKNSEKFLTFSIDNFDFIDSMKFLEASLSDLCGILKDKGIQYFHHTKCHFKNSRQFLLALRKGVYCYDYVDSIAKLKCKHLPSKHKFYDKLNDKDISDLDFHHAQTVWKVFKCNNLEEYTNVYLKIDVLLLADIFEAFRNSCMKWYGLDPAHYISCPQLSNDAFLKMSKIKLELISDVDQYNFFESSLRGGFSTVVNKYAKANNMYLSDYDPNEPSSFLFYCDMINLYGWSMTQYLGYKNFNWLSRTEIKALDLTNLQQDKKIGYMLEVTLEYPKQLHDSHSDFPLAPVKKRSSFDQLSPASKYICNKFKLKTSMNCMKLVSDFSPRVKYVLHYRTLELYIRLGLKVTEVHRVISFNQKPFMKKFIEFNTKQRMQANNPFDVAFFKFMNNSLFGKQIENVKKRSNVTMVTEKERFVKLTSQPNFKTFKIVNDNMVTVQMTKPCVLLCKPIYIGVVVLEYSKCKMFEFHYEYMLKKYGYDRVKLCMSDTDSFLYQIFTNDLYHDLKTESDHFDFSNYPKEHFLYSAINKKRVGFMKDETASKPISEFVGLRSKMYSFLVSDKNVKAAKGVKRSSLQHLHHRDYKQVLKNCTQTEENFYSIISKSHQIYTIHQRKIGLSPFDDKRYLNDDFISTLPYCHYRIEDMKRKSEDQGEVVRKVVRLS